METNKWYVNQKVWDKTVSDEAGEIIDILEDCFYPVKVFFNHRTIYYDLSGKLEFNKLPTLSTKNYEIKMEGFSQEVEKEELPKKGQVCWGSNNEGGKWYIGHFVKKEFKNYILNTTVDDENTGGHFTIITTKNPYEVEEDREPQIGDMVYAWSDLKHGFVYGELQLIESSGYPYIVKYHGGFKHCSLKNPLIK